jgi:hypothetical protein
MKHTFHTNLNHVFGQNSIISAILTLLLIVFILNLSPTLNNTLQIIIDSTITRVIVLLSIVIILSVNKQIALIMSIAFVLLIASSNNINQIIKQEDMSNIDDEGKSLTGLPNNFSLTGTE